MNKSSLIFPDFILGGVQKCGTSSLAIHLDRHPELTCSVPKEPDFFSSTYVREENRDYEVFFPEKAGKMFEASTGYFQDPKAAKLIKETMGGETKFIFILRDPVERVISAYYHMFKHNAEKRSPEEVFSDMPADADDIYDFENVSLKAALQKGLVDNRRQYRYDDHFLQFRYVYNSLYRRHYQVYADLFGKDNILLLGLDDFADDPKQVFSKIESFLNISTFDMSTVEQRAYNRTQIPKYLLFPYIRRNAYLVEGFDFLRKIAHRMGQGKYFLMDAPEFPDEIKGKLEQLLAPEAEFVKSISLLQE